jgi:GAF domain-containing protein
VALQGTSFLDLIESFSSDVAQLGRTLRDARSEAMQLLVDDTLDTIARKLRQMFRAERASVYLADPQDGSLRSASAFHNGADGVRVTLPKGTGPAGRAALEARTVTALGPGVAADLLPCAEQLRGCQPRSVVAVPVRAQAGEVIAVAELINRAAGGEFTVSDQSAFEELAVQLQPVLSRCAALQPVEGE